MADYSAYLPQTAGLESFVGLSPEKLAQIREYATPDNVGRIHPMGGMALAGEDRREQNLGAYLDMLNHNNALRSGMFQQAGDLNLREAAINQIGRVTQAIGKDRLTALAGSEGQQRLFPGMLSENGRINPGMQADDAHGQGVDEAKRQQALGAAGLNSVNAGYTPDVQAFAQEMGLPMRKTAPVAENVAGIRASASGRGGGVKSQRKTTHFEGNTMITDTTPLPAGGGGGGGGTTTNAPDPNSSTTQPIEVAPESLSPGQRKMLEAAMKEADDAGVQFMGVYDYGDAVPQAVVEMPDGSNQYISLEDNGN